MYGPWSAGPRQMELHCLVRGCCRERHLRLAALPSPWGFRDSTTPTPLKATKTLAFTVMSAPGGPLAITSPLPPATTGLPYSQALTASGGTPPYVWSLVSGVPPNGITLSSAGVLSGTPTQSGTVIFTVMATNSTTTGAQTATGSFELAVG